MGVANGRETGNHLGRLSLNHFCPEAGITQVHGEVQQADALSICPIYHPVTAFHRNAWRRALAEDSAHILEILASLQA